MVGGGLDGVAEGEESVGGHDGTLEGFVAFVFFGGFADGLLDGADAVLFAGADGEGLAVFGDDDTVGADVDVDVPGEEEVVELLGRGLAVDVDAAVFFVFVVGGDEVGGGF